MTERRILVVDHKPKNLKLFEGYFGEGGYLVDTAAGDVEALRMVEGRRYDVVLCELSGPGIDGFLLLRELQRRPERPLPSVVFISAKSDAWTRLRAVKLGVKDFITTPVHAREIVARVEMIRRRAERFERSERAPRPFSGRLEDFSLVDLIERFTREKKSGLLLLVNENGFSGQLIFRSGCIFRAEAGLLRAEDAVYKMMNWRRGVFSVCFGQVDVADEMTLSNMGMLLQGVKRMDLRNELLKQLPSLDAVVITTANFKKILAQKEPNPELLEFLSLFDGERTLGRIIDECRENEIVALKRIVKLYRLGFLHVLRDFDDGRMAATESAPLPGEEIEPADELQVPFFLRPQGAVDLPFTRNEPEQTAHEPFPFPFQEPSPQRNERVSQESAPETPEAESLLKRFQTGAGPVRAEQIGTVLVIGADEEKARRTVERMTSSLLQQEHISGLDLQYSTLTFSGGAYLTLFCAAIDREFSPIVDFVEKELLGIIVVLDEYSRNWSYYRYLLHVLQRKTDAPLHVLYHAGEAGNAELDTVRARLSAGERVSVHVQPTFEPAVLRRLLFLIVKKQKPEAAELLVEKDPWA